MIRFLSWFDRFLLVLMLLFASLTLAGIVAGFVTPSEDFSPFVKHTQEWLTDTSADFANTWAIILVAMGADRFAAIELQRAEKKEKLEILGKLELLFYPLHFPLLDPETKQWTTGIIPRRNFNKLVELRPIFKASFPKNTDLDQLIALIGEEDKYSRIGMDNPEIFFQTREVKTLVEKLTQLS
ncbi:hypothetical protein FAI41_04005 [Acetobacteraceae bacterium]|nr:hypothetical protein FAI41_04005 [Acetobacteraceae bacterium]